jgi:hypothetical protein
MRRLAFVLTLVLVAAVAGSGRSQQLRPPMTAGGSTSAPGIGFAQIYGEPMQVSLDRLSTHLADLERKAVRTRGLLDKTNDGWFRLHESVDEVLLIPVDHLDRNDVNTLFGMPVELAGLAREIPERQGTCIFRFQSVPDSVCKDWNLPALPDHAGHPEWPQNSVTFWSIIDARPLERPNASGSAIDLADILHSPERFKGKTVSVVGRFRGANLFGDLPTASRVDPSDWVVSDGDVAVWVTGKAPRGSGFSLSLESRADSRWWMEVTGEVQQTGDVVRIRAKRLTLVRQAREE